MKIHAPLRLVGVCFALTSLTLAHADDTVLPEVIVQAQRTVAQKYDLPNTTASITADKIAETINLIDAEDAIKYLPSIFVRKRNNGDTQAVVETRTWGVASSARSLVYADDILLTALIANDNNNGAPRWGMVSPEEIERIDMIYGPFAAQYPGNSMGGVINITTRMPDHLEATVDQTESFQDFNLYNSHDTYRTDETSASIGDRIDRFSWFVSANHLHNFSQPLTFATTTASTSIPNFGSTGFNAAGAVTAVNKTGLNSYVVGALGLLDTDMYTLKLKFAFDITPEWRGSYSFGLWTNDSSTTPQTYLTSTAASTFGARTYAGIAGFTGGAYKIYEEHTMHALSLKSDTGGAWDFESVATHYNMDTDHQYGPGTTLIGTTGGPTLAQATAAQLTAFTPYGTEKSLDGSGWTTLDAKTIYRVDGKPGLADAGSNEFSFGAHGDWFKLKLPTYNVTDWQSGDASPVNANSILALNSLGQGKTETYALWAQDAWKILPGVTATAGGRIEWWKTFDGYVASLTGAQNGPSSLNYIAGTTKDVSAAAGLPAASPAVSSNAKFSPKLSLAWEPLADWSIKANYGTAYRFPTVFELYQNSLTGSAPYTIPNPSLHPERDQSEELALEYHPQANDMIRLSLFWENDFNYIASQTSQQTLNGVTALFSYNQNIDEIRNRGAELAFDAKNVLIDGFDISGSATYLNANIIHDGLVRSTGSLANNNTPALVSVVGNHVPNVPDWRGTLVLTYRPAMQWALTAAGRYQSRTISTLDNADTVFNVYQSFGSFFVVDLRARDDITENIAVSFGIDNVNNAKYWEFHPFPERSYVADIHVKF